MNEQIFKLEQQKRKLYIELTRLELIDRTIDEQFKILREIETLENEIICLSIY